MGTAVQWFPGHMHTTRLAMVERFKSGIDVVIELLDGEEGVAPGQACVLYADGSPQARVLGGGTIARRIVPALAPSTIEISERGAA